MPPRCARGGWAGPGGAGRAEEGSCRSSRRRPPACPGLASGRSLRLLPAPSPSPPVLPSPLVHDGNTMAAAAQLSLTQVTPPAHPLGSVGRCPRSTRSSLRRQGFTDPGIFSRRRAGRRIVRARACVRVCRREGAIPSRLPRRGSRDPARVGGRPRPRLSQRGRAPHPSAPDRDPRPAQLVPGPSLSTQPSPTREVSSLQAGLSQVSAC